MKTITNRSKIAVRTTTAPGDMGYDGQPTNWLTAAPDIITSPSKALDYVASLKRRLGGAFFAVEYRRGDDVIDAQALTEAVIRAEHKGR